TFTPSPRLPPQGAQGGQHLLALADNQSEPLWDSEQFAPSEEGVWRLGVGSLTEGGTIFITPPLDVFESAYGNDPANRITVAEAELSLIVYNPPLPAEDAGYFGLLLQSADDPTLNAGVQVNLVNLSSIRLSQRVGDSLETISQRSDDARNLRVRLERNVEAETITVYVDNQQLGIPIPFEGDEPVIPVLYVRRGGVIVHVLNWSVTLR